MKTTEEKMTKSKSVKNDEKLTCPKCEAAGVHVTFTDKRGRGTHRRFKHGVRGVSASTLAYRNRHDKLARGAEAKPVHPKQTAMVPVAEQTVVTRIKPAEISVAMLGYAMGRLEALAEQIARENGLPEKEFVKQTAVNLAALVQRS
jgi:hypothetical protein